MAIRTRRLWLDYGEAARKPKLLRNLSAAAMAGRFLWTASDEGRSVECLEPTREGFRLCRQLGLDTLFRRLPGAAQRNEADLESIDVAHGQLWICGSHCLVRKKKQKVEMAPPNPTIGPRPSRALLGAIGLTADGGNVEGTGEALPHADTGSLRKVLGTNPFIKPFIGLPSKENGLDIEGMVVFRNKAFVGLRGPRVDSIALVIQLQISRLRASPGLKIDRAAEVTHFLDLGGLAVRDLTRWKDDVLILAGPVGDADGPFRLYRWHPRKQDKVQSPAKLHEWTSTTEHPEGICALDRGRTHGLLVLYDSPNRDLRIQGSRYRADWLVGL